MKNMALEGLLPLNNYFIISICRDRIYEGEWAYKKHKIVFISIKESFLNPTYFTIHKNGNVLPILTDQISGFVGVYHESEISTESFMTDLQVAFKDL
ncbi:MAG: hypothetical protein ACRCX2_33995 [Paraclostridium sp.]